MSELLPTVIAESIREGLVDFLRTTFALADADASAALADFLEDPEGGIFRGPYLRLRLPFKPADEGWRETLDWYGASFPPYGHQAGAFARLTSRGLGLDRPRPEPTLVTTGTGSGKTEAFLYPIIDHVLRASAAGVTGMKALVLYPMNALANDQAGRLANILSGDPRLSGITAALYTGQAGPKRTKVSIAGLITDRAIIRSSAPDILLTNYKMLDLMLLRAADSDIWRQSALSLQYLVLDEFHTYDGAQGTDVSMLLRRLGLTLKSHWPDDHPALTPADRTRPLGRMTPVATSATLGDRGDPAAMLQFAETVFGEPFPPSSVVTETRMAFDEWAQAGFAPGQSGAAADPDIEPIELTETHVAQALAALAILDSEDGAAIAAAVLSPLADRVIIETAEQLALVKRLSLTRALAERTADATAVRELVGLVPGNARDAEVFLLAFVAAMSHIRAVQGLAALTVDLHLWIRELTRIDRGVSLVPSFHWADDGVLDTDTATRLPALYCRLCGRSGWGVVLAPVGEDLDRPAAGIRASRAANNERFRALIHAPGEGERARAGAPPDGFRWFLAAESRLSATDPGDEAALRDGRVLPVLTHVGMDAGELSRSDTCPSCLRREGIRFLGSAIATQLSVAMSTVFGNPELDKREKKALVFTDSVQDAAHRAGFIQSRSHILTLRTVIRQAVGDNDVSLDHLVDRIIQSAGDDKHRRYRLLPPNLADAEQFADFWQRPRLSQVPPRVRNRVRKRLLLDVQLEFGLQSRVGRTLDLTGSVSAHVDVPEARLAAAGQSAIAAATQDVLNGMGPDRAAVIAWVRGTLERMRERGAIEHDWFKRYQAEDGNRFTIWLGRPRQEGMPAFPIGRAAPGYPRIGGSRSTDNDLDPVTSPQSWYALWTAKCLGITPREAAVLARLLLERLARAGDLGTVTSASGATLYQLAPSALVVTPISRTALEQGRHELACGVCQTVVPGAAEVTDQLDGRPCTVARCPGTLHRVSGHDNFYRQLYASTDVQRVVAREHTGQLDDETRLAYETGFKSSADDPQAPNVLVATPTLEMGIDIGDLSTVMLASLPRSVASYLQRVGRAGRLTGNALNLAFVTGRGDQLPQLGEPLSVINGEVRPPATYVDAEEILRRQYVASVADRLARDPSAPHPTRATEALNATDETGYVRVLIRRAEVNAEQYLEEFLVGFPALSGESAAELRRWATPPAGPDSSALAVRLYQEAFRWATTVEQLQLRVTEIEGALAELQQRAESPAATEEDREAFRTARAALKLARSQIAEQRGEFWISILEERGIFPNYTLVDDSVTLDVAFSWIDPETGEFRNEPETFTRGAAMALRDFPPGATFYGRGHRIRVDAVELGIGNEGVRTWVYCPSCGYSRDLAEGPPAACPRCGSPGFSDVAQQLPSVELTRVSSAMRREEAAIDDATDEREREAFTIVTSADIDPEKTVHRWFVEGSGFGVRHLRDLRIQWTNLGRAAGQGTPLTISGRDHAASLFRVCAHCGQLDRATHTNRPTEHRPWCPQRRLHEENTRSVVLTRSLVTEGLVVRLPALIGIDDPYAIPSLSAALLLGLRERIGGAPDHLAVESIIDPAPADGGESNDALLLHDIVPGGTGYLADLSEPGEFWDILRRAWERVRTCPCADEGRLACHRCLLPFAPGGRASQLVSRVTAERHLRAILGGDEEVPANSPWVITHEEGQAFDPETGIEKLFRKALIDRLAAIGAQVEERPGAQGNRLIISTGGGRQWRLEPQQLLGPAKPDFVLHSNQPQVPRVAIFCDGWRYHASPEINRLADDAEKRSLLRADGHVVLGISWAELEAGRSGGSPELPWFDADTAAAVKSRSESGWTQRRVDVLAGGAVGWLIDWIRDPDPTAQERVANWLPVVVTRHAQQGAGAEATSAVDLARAALRGHPLGAKSSTAWVWRDDTVALASRHLGGPMDNIETALIIDDRSVALGPEHKAAWHSWLSLSNALAGRMRPTVIGTLSQMPAAAVSTGEVAGSGAWGTLHAGATAAEKAVLVLLAEHEVPLPELGVESAGGIPVAISWPDLAVALDLELTDVDRAELATEGWAVLGIDDALQRLTGVGS